MAGALARLIRDPVHGYVEVPPELDPLVRSAAVQRLRMIRQNALAIIQFPSMTGSRYEHALGTTASRRRGVAGLLAQPDARRRRRRYVIDVGEVQNRASSAISNAPWRPAPNSTR